MLMEIKQWMWAQWGNKWYVSAMVTASGVDVYEHNMQLLFIAGKNAELTVVTMMKNSVL